MWNDMTWNDMTWHDLTWYVLVGLTQVWAHVLTCCFASAIPEWPPRLELIQKSCWFMSQAQITGAAITHHQSLASPCYLCPFTYATNSLHSDHLQLSRIALNHPRYLLVQLAFPKDEHSTTNTKQHQPVEIRRWNAAAPAGLTWRKAQALHLALYHIQRPRDDPALALMLVEWRVAKMGQAWREKNTYFTSCSRYQNEIFLIFLYQWHCDLPVSIMLR